MLYRVIATGTRTFGRFDRASKGWTTTVQIPLFWVDAIDEENAVKIADDVVNSLGQFGDTSITAIRDSTFLSKVW